MTGYAEEAGTIITLDLAAGRDAEALDLFLKGNIKQLGSKDVNN